MYVINDNDETNDYSDDDKMTAIKKYNYSDRDPITNQIIGYCYEIHTQLGPGFVERIYTNALKMIFDSNNIQYETEKEYPVKFNNKIIGKFRVDFIIEDKVIVEIKAVTGILPKIFETQVISYLKASKINVGLLVNFRNRRCEIRRLMLSPSSKISL